MKVINVNYNGPSHGRKNAVLKLPLLKKKIGTKNILKIAKLHQTRIFARKKIHLFLKHGSFYLFFAFRKFIKSISRRLYVHR